MNLVPRIRNRIEGMLNSDWDIDDGDATLVVKYTPFGRRVQAAKRVEIKAQFWVDAAKDRVTFELVSDEEHKDLRESLAASFREFLQGHQVPKKCKYSKSSTIIRVPSPTVRSEGGEAAAASLVSFIKDHIGSWMKSAPEL
jgi:hypothetical protein